MFNHEAHLFLFSKVTHLLIGDPYFQVKPGNTKLSSQFGSFHRHTQLHRLFSERKTETPKRNGNAYVQQGFRHLGFHILFIHLLSGLVRQFPLQANPHRRTPKPPQKQPAPPASQNHLPSCSQFYREPSWYLPQAVLW